MVSVLSKVNVSLLHNERLVNERRPLLLLGLVGESSASAMLLSGIASLAAYAFPHNNLSWLLIFNAFRSVLLTQLLFLCGGVVS